MKCDLCGEESKTGVIYRYELPFKDHKYVCSKCRHCEGCGENDSEKLHGFITSKHCWSFCNKCGYGTLPKDHRDLVEEQKKLHEYLYENQNELSRKQFKAGIKKYIDLGDKISSYLEDL